MGAPLHCYTCVSGGEFLDNWGLKRSAPTNGLMSALTGLSSTLFFRQRCIIVDTIIRNPIKFSPKRNYSVHKPTTPMSYNSHDP